MKTPPLLTLAAALAATLLASSCSNNRQLSAPAAPAFGGAYVVPSGEAESLASSPATGRHSPAPEDRSGLATGWGVEKSSQTYGRHFTRASDTPVGTDRLYYNDAAGIKDMAGSTQRVAAMQPAADGLVEWGIKGRIQFLPTYRERHSGRRLVQGDRDSSYSIVVRNKAFRTLEVVLSVDGLDVMDGKSASFAKRGYLIEPGKSLTVDGFRTSNASVASFRFSSVAGSYANRRHGDTRNVGVIGLAVFTPKGSREWATGPRDHARPFAEPF